MDRVSGRGRPRKPTAPKVSCLRRRTLDVSDIITDNTIWHKNADSFRGLKSALSLKPKTSRTKNHLLTENICIKKNVWLDINGVVLTTEDQKMIIKTDEWISDNIVNASQRLLQKHFPNVKGLQNVLLSEISCLEKPMDWTKYHDINRQIEELTQKKKKAFEIIATATKTRDNAEEEEVLKAADKLVNDSNEIVNQCDKQLTELKQFCIKTEGLQPLERNAKFVQILLDKTQNRSHWVCVSNMKTKSFSTVRIYDSDLSQIKCSIQNYSNFLKIALKRLYFESDVDIELPLVSQSPDSTSGGVYAIAFAQALCEGYDPSDILFSCSPKQMRLHLLQSLSTCRLQRFPTGKIDIFWTRPLTPPLLQRMRQKSKSKNDSKESNSQKKSMNE